MQKVICTKKLYAEIHKWECCGISRSNQMVLLKLYIGMGVDYLVDNQRGRIHCCDFNKVANMLHFHYPKRIVELVVKSGSFTYGKCDSSNINIYGIMWFSSPIYPRDPLLDVFKIESPENSPKNNTISGHYLDIYNNNIYDGHSGKAANGEKEKAAAPKFDHPHGPFEYCIPGNTQRLYDNDGYATPIPYDAPDRPSATATWRKFQRKWDDPEDISLNIDDDDDDIDIIQFL